MILIGDSSHNTLAYLDLNFTDTNGVASSTSTTLVFVLFDNVQKVRDD